jgi:hypothetical protein
MSEEQNVEVVEEVTEVSEASDAAGTLKPKASKSEMLGDLMRTAGAMKKDDLSIFLQKVLDQVGKEDETVDDTSAQNAASIAMKPTGAPKPGSEASYAMKEDVAELFAGQEDLSEDFTERATTLFEAAVNNRVDLEVARIEEEYESKLEEQVSKSIDELHEQVNTYMDYVVEKWMEENAVALENNYRVEATDQFIEGLKGLFAENYVEVPAEKIDMIGDLEQKVAELEESLNAAEAEKIKMSAEIQQAQVQDAFDSVSEGLVATQTEKLRTLSEGIEFSSVEEYSEKLQIIKDQYFSESTSSEESKTGLIVEEETVGSNDEISEDRPVPVEMRSYVQAISNTIKK